MIEPAPLSKASRWFWQGLAVWTLLLSVLAAWSAAVALSGLGVDFVRSKWPLFFAGLAVAIGLSIWLLATLRTGRPIRFVGWIEGLGGAGPVVKGLSLLTVPAAFGLSLFARDLTLTARMPLAGTWWVLWMVWAPSLVSALALRAAFGGKPAALVALVLLIQGVAFKVLSYIPDLSSCPLSLSWSEASRYYYASLPFAERLYGQQIPLSVLHPTRYFLQAIPFLIPDSPLWAHRLWQVVLWLGMTAVTSVLLVRRLRPSRGLPALLLGMWFFLYLFQGAVYYHLQICIWIVLLGVRPGHRWRSLLAVVLASAWAGMSRVNWFPVPAMLAAGIYFLEAPTRTGGSWLRYLIQPVTWFIAGLAAAFAAQAAYIYLSGNGGNQAAFGSSFTSDLLWYRLWPNPTFAPGIVWGIVLAMLPVLGVIVHYALTKGRALHPVRWFGLGALLAALFFAGLLVSVKIGGGGDLHNMDAFLTLLGIVGATLFLDRAAAEHDDSVPFEPHFGLTLFAILVPLTFAVLYYRPPTSLGCGAAEQDLARLRRLTQQATQRGGEVLFLSQRQLLTFGDIANVPLVPEYEKLMLNEMALSRNQAYLDTFYDDLRQHRFAIIVAPPGGTHRDTVEQFSEEDNRWVDVVDSILHCEYQTQASLPRADVEILVPRKGETVCP